jgi:hypothetical protein
MDCFAYARNDGLNNRRHTFIVIAREGGRSSIPETPVMESRSRGVLDTPLEPVIGLAEGETRWRGMTTVKAEPVIGRAFAQPVGSQ